MAQTASTVDGLMRRGAAARTKLDNAFSGMTNQVVGGIFAIVIGVVMLNVLYGLDIINETGAFGDLFDTVESIGGAAITFVVLGMLALAGGTAVRMYRS